MMNDNLTIKYVYVTRSKNKTEPCAFIKVDGCDTVIVLCHPRPRHCPKDDIDSAIGLINHEIMHEVLLETIGMKQSNKWDNLAHELGKFIGNCCPCGVDIRWERKRKKKRRIHRGKNNILQTKLGEFIGAT